MIAPRHLRAALRYAALGWPVFPLSAGSKLPAIPKERGGSGVLDATVDVDLVESWWHRMPTANIGLATGTASGLLVLDVDPRHGGDESLRALQLAHGLLPATLTARTPSGGSHIVFEHVPGLRNSAGKVGAGLDTRGDGGYVVAAPSVTSAGSYAWTNWGEPVALLPAWLGRLLAPPPAPVAAPLVLPAGQGTRYAEAALEAEAERVRSAGEGVRNHTLNAAAYSLGQLVGAGLLEDWRAAQVLLDAALRCGLGTVEAQQTILSGLNAGARQPRVVAS